MDISRSACLVALCVAILMGGSIAARSCDELVGHLFSKAITPAIEGLGCEGINQAGLDRPDHHLQSVCYTSDGATSSLEVVANLRCKTSDNAFLKASVSDTVTAKAQVRGKDCQLLDIDVNAGGDIGQIFIRSFNVNGIARTKLQSALEKLCQ